MKTDIYTLLGMIKDDKAPKIIRFKNNYYEYQNEEQDYLCQINGVIWLFDEYVITDILTDEVEILETTITLNNSFNYLQKLAEDEIPDKIEKLERVEDFKFARLIDKINEIIEVLNER